MDIQHTAKLNVLIGGALFLVSGGWLAYEFFFVNLPPGYHLPQTFATHNLLITTLLFATIATACYIALFIVLLFLYRPSSHDDCDTD